MYGRGGLRAGMGGPMLGWQPPKPPPPAPKKEEEKKKEVVDKVMRECMIPREVVDIRVGCTQLLAMDRYSLSDPLIALFVQHPTTKLYSFRSRTEMLSNTHNPSFATAFRVTVGGPVQAWLLKVLFVLFAIVFVLTSSNFLFFHLLISVAVVC